MSKKVDLIISHEKFVSCLEIDLNKIDNILEWHFIKEVGELYEEVKKHRIYGQDVRIRLQAYLESEE